MEINVHLPKGFSDVHDVLDIPFQMTETPLHKAAANNHVEILKFLLEWQGEEKAELEANNMVSLRFSFCRNNESIDAL